MEHQKRQRQLISLQRNEVSEYHTYRWLAKRIRSDRNREILERIANDERGHYQVFKQLTGGMSNPDGFRSSYIG